MSSLEEPVLLVPPRLTQSAYATLSHAACVPRRWHLEGRYGSRTHCCEDGKMGLPILPSVVESISGHRQSLDSDLRSLLSTDGVELVYKTVPAPKNLPREEPFDATIHSERKDEMKWKSQKEQSSNAGSFTFLELFAGIGGFGVALEALGGTCVFASELDAKCRYLYKTNVSSFKMYGDIYDVPEEAIPPHDLLVGGFPCQSFSSLGTQDGFRDTRGRLYLEVVRLLKLRQPRAFLLENVPGLLQTDHGSAIQTIISDLQDAGYTVSMEVCNARCLTAQSRKRLFLVGLRNGLAQKPFSFPYIPDLGLRAQDIIEFHDQCEEMYHVTNQQMNQLVFMSKRWKPAHLAWPDGVCDTLDSHYGVTVGKGNSQLVAQHCPQNPRCYTPRECARLMGFPNRYVLPQKEDIKQGSRAFLKEQYRMLGNAVCPPLVAAISGAILDCFDEDFDWEQRGRATAINLALDAVLPHRKAILQKRLEVELL